MLIYYLVFFDPFYPSSPLIRLINLLITDSRAVTLDGVLSKSVSLEASQSRALSVTLDETRNVVL